MSIPKKEHNFFISILIFWFPAIISAILCFLVPPAAFAVIAAYFAAPVVKKLHDQFRLPYTLSALLVMFALFILALLLIYITLYGIVSTVPSIERHVAEIGGKSLLSNDWTSMIQEKVTGYSNTILQYSLSVGRDIFQHLFGLVIFLIAFFFALRESGKNRFWFLVYFPTSMRNQARHMLMEGGRIIGTFLSVEARLFMLTFTILSIGFALFRFHTPVGTAFLIALADSLPLLGIGLFMIPMALFFFYVGNFFLGTMIVFLYLFSMLSRQIAESYMYASSFSVKPVHAFFITASSFYLFGLPGILMTPFLLFFAFKLKGHQLFAK